MIAPSPADAVATAERMVPFTVGSIEASNRVRDAAVIAAVATDSPVVVTSPLVAVTNTVITLPISAGTKVYVELVAPTMFS